MGFPVHSKSLIQAQASCQENGASVRQRGPQRKLLAARQASHSCLDARRRARKAESGGRRESGMSGLETVVAHSAWGGSTKVDERAQTLKLVITKAVK